MRYAFLLLLCSGLAQGVVSEPLGQAAEYYFQRHDYRQALSLWGETLRRRPDHVGAVLRVAELKLLFEGRPAAREALAKFLTAQQATLSGESRRAIREKWSALQSAFLTDEGQSIFLQALPRIRRKDCAGAIGLLSQSLGFERGNVRVLREKAKCEKALGQIDRYYETLKAADDADPFAMDIVEALMEAHIFHSALDQVATVAQPLRDDATRSIRFRIALAVALSETGGTETALPMLQSMVEQERATVLHPVVYLTIGKILSKQLGSSSESASYLERFLSLVEVPDSTLIDGWDPYRARERVEEARQLLAKQKNT